MDHLVCGTPNCKHHFIFRWTEDDRSLVVIISSALPSCFYCHARNGDTRRAVPQRRMDTLPHYYYRIVHDHVSYWRNFTCRKLINTRFNFIWQFQCYCYSKNRLSCRGSYFCACPDRHSSRFLCFVCFFRARIIRFTASWHSHTCYVGLIPRAIFNRYFFI